MNRTDFLKTLAVISALPLLRVVNAQSNYDQAVKKCAYMINMSNKLPLIGRVGIEIPYKYIREMDVEFIKRYIKPARRIQGLLYYDLNSNKSKLFALQIIFNNNIELKNFLAEVYPYLDKFNKKDYIKKFL